MNKKRYFGESEEEVLRALTNKSCPVLIGDVQNEITGNGLVTGRTETALFRLCENGMVDKRYRSKKTVLYSINEYGEKCLKAWEYWIQTLHSKGN